MIQGLRTVIYPVADIAVGKAFYSSVLGQEPYFDQPFYVGFHQAGFELGLIPDAPPGATGSIAYWGVEDIQVEYDRLISLGAKPQEKPNEVGEGIAVATVLDPFGNVFGIIRNTHFDAKRVG